MMIAIAMMVIVMFMDTMVRPTVSTILVVSAVLKVVVFLVRISQLIVRILVGVPLVTILVLVLVVVVGMLFTALVGDLRPVTLMIRFVLHDLCVGRNAGNHYNFITMLNHPLTCRLPSGSRTLYFPVVYSPSRISSWPKDRSASSSSTS